jgi:very-short-patch-repair endonuclease
VDTVELATHLMRKQWGVASRTQLEAVGLTPRQVSRLTQVHGFARLHHGVLGMPQRASSAYGDAYAAQLAAPSPRAAATGITALAALGIDVVRYTADEVLPAEAHDPELVRTRRRSQLIIHAGPLPEIRSLRGTDLRVCAPLPSLARVFAADDRVRAVWAAEDGLRKGILKPADLEALSQCVAASRVSWLRAVDQRSQSPLETWSRLAAADDGIVGLAPQVPVLTASGERFVDLGLLALRLGWECDGKLYHPIDGPTYFADRRRERLLRDAGWEIYRIRWSDMLLFPERTLREMHAAIEGRARRLRRA